MPSGLPTASQPYAHPAITGGERCLLGHGALGCSTTQLDIDGSCFSSDTAPATPQGPPEWSPRAVLGSRCGHTSAPTSEARRHQAPGEAGPRLSPCPDFSLHSSLLVSCALLPPPHGGRSSSEHPPPRSGLCLVPRTAHTNEGTHRPPEAAGLRYVSLDVGAARETPRLCSQPPRLCSQQVLRGAQICLKPTKAPGSFSVHPERFGSSKTAAHVRPPFQQLCPELPPCKALLKL